MYLQGLFPCEKMGGTLPPIVLKHQIYSIIKNKTTVDREIVRHEIHIIILYIYYIIIYIYICVHNFLYEILSPDIIKKQWKDTTNQTRIS